MLIWHVENELSVDAVTVAEYVPGEEYVNVSVCPVNSVATAPGAFQL
jgi:hypothetical protein